MTNMKERLHYYDIAKEKLLDLKILTTCKKHDDFIFYNNINKLTDKEIYVKATNLLKQNNAYIDYKEFHKQIKNVLCDHNCNQTCPYCEKFKKE